MPFLWTNLAVVDWRFHTAIYYKRSRNKVTTFIFVTSDRLGNRKFVSKALLEKFLQTYAQSGVKYGVHGSMKFSLICRIHKINMPAFPQEMSELCSFHGDAIRAFKVCAKVKFVLHSLKLRSLSCTSSLVTSRCQKYLPISLLQTQSTILLVQLHCFFFFFTFRFYTFLDNFAEKISMKNWKNYRGDIGVFVDIAY
jgi:hypothetical protein